MKEQILKRMFKHFINNQERLDAWLDKKNVMLDNKTPRELLESGQEQEVLDLIKKSIGE